MNKKTKILIAILMFILLSAGGLSYYQKLDASHAFSEIQPAAQGSSPESPDDQDIGTILEHSNAVYVLFLGIDKNDERDLTMGVYRTDTIALARFDFITQKVKILSIPRDTYTYVPVEDKRDKINHAYAYGSLQGKGPEESIRAVNQLIGQDLVDYYFLIDMEQIPEIVDEIGGVTVDVDMDMNSGEVVVHKGVQVLDGKHARAYIRYRKSPGGDIDRIRHQQKFMLSLYRQQKAANKLLETVQLGLKYRDNIRTDLSVQQIIALGRFMNDLPQDSVEYSIIPGNAQMINGISYWVMNENKSPKIIDEFLQ